MGFLDRIAKNIANNVVNDLEWRASTAVANKAVDAVTPHAEKAFTGLANQVKASAAAVEEAMYTEMPVIAKSNDGYYQINLASKQRFTYTFQSAVTPMKVFAIFRFIPADGRNLEGDQQLAGTLHEPLMDMVQTALNEMSNKGVSTEELPAHVNEMAASIVNQASGLLSNYALANAVVQFVSVMPNKGGATGGVGAAPVASAPAGWTCGYCGSANKAGNFCEACGAAKG